MVRTITFFQVSPLFIFAPPLVPGQISKRSCHQAYIMINLFYALIIVQVLFFEITSSRTVILADYFNLILYCWRNSSKSPHLSIKIS